MLGLVPALLGDVPGLPVRAAAAALRVPARTARRAAAAAGTAGRVVAAAARGERETWTAAGRTHLHVAGLTGPRGAELARALEEALVALSGVDDARADVASGRVTVAHVGEGPALEALLTLVQGVEDAVGSDGDGDGGSAPFPSDSRPLVAEGVVLAADVAALAGAVAGKLLRLPALPGSAVAALSLLENQPRARAALERRLGHAGAEVVLSTTTAALHGLAQNVFPLLVDTGQRAALVRAVRARRDVVAAREHDLLGPHRPGRTEPLHVPPRPVPVPAGPVERLADRSALATLPAAAAVLVATRDLDLAGRTVLAGVPRAARAAREAFAGTLEWLLAGRGVLVVDPSALRRLDRVDTVVVEHELLLGEQRTVRSAHATGDWADERVWRTARRLLGTAAPGGPPPADGAARLERVDGAVPERARLVVDGAVVGEVVLGREPDPLADAVLGAARAAGVTLLLTAGAADAGLAGLADALLPAAPPGTADDEHLVGEVQRLQAGGAVVCHVGRREGALRAADVAVGVAPADGRVPWSADVLCGPGLADVPRLLAAVPAARGVSRRGVRLSVAASFLSGLLLAVGRRSGFGQGTVPVTAAGGSALLSGALAARRVARLPAPEPVLHTRWHELDPDEVLDRLPAPADPPPEQPGAGRSPALRRLRPLVQLVRAVRAELDDPLTPVLGTGAAASAVVGAPVDAALVGGVMAASAVISGAQRMRADRALAALLERQEVTARLLAADGVRTVPAARLQPGSRVTLEAGDVVPADARLLEVDDLEVDESTLTGESTPVPKQVRATPGAELPDRACLVHEGATVVAGSGTAVVVAVGPATAAGRALALAGPVAPPAGMQRRLEQLTARVLPVTVLGGAAVTGLSLLRGCRLREALGSGVSVAVAAVPEGLPLLATAAQAGAARRLSGPGVLVRSPRTLEALGRVDTVCFDKTGTLTEGRLHLVSVADLSGVRDPADPAARRVLQAAGRAGPRAGGHALPHATDQAVSDAAERVLGPGLLDGWAELGDVPFQSSRGFSAAVGRTPGAVRLVVKGAPEVLLPRCTRVRDGRGERPLDAAGRERAAAVLQELAAEGLRVLAVARRSVADLDPAERVPAEAEDLEDLTLLGFLGLADTPRPTAPRAVAALAAAGLGVVMITGDHPVTARTVARRLGVPEGRLVTGPELSGADERRRAELVAGATVFARVTPEQKVQVVRELQAAGRVVAMVGDGANDAAAIRRADVGIGIEAHGSGSARRAGDLVLTRPDVTLVVDALVEGRAMWRRVRDAVSLLVGGNAGEVAFTVAGTALAGRAPINTRQFLVVNLFTDLLPSLALALAPTPSDARRRAALLAGRPPSLGEPLVRDILARGSFTAAGALAAWWLGRLTGGPRRASTIGLATLVGAELGQTLLLGGRQPLVVGTAVGSVAALVALVQVPVVSRFAGCTPLDPFAWAVVLACSAAATLAAALRARALAVPGRRAGV